MTSLADTINIHRFLDEAGDTTFFGKGKVCRLGEEGVSSAFILGMVKYKQNINEIRQKIIDLEKAVENDLYFKEVPSIQKRVSKGGFYFHATDDVPEVRKLFFDFIKTTDFSFEAVVGRKILDIFVNKHNGRDTEFYADLLSHLLKNKLKQNQRLILNIAARGTSTLNKNLQLALEKATDRYAKKKSEGID